jgi:hypothetical protein
MPGGKAALIYAATPAALFSVGLPDGGVSLCAPAAAAAAGAGVGAPGGPPPAPAALFCREPSELLLCLAAPPGGAPAGALLQLT